MTGMLAIALTACAVPIPAAVESAEKPTWEDSYQLGAKYLSEGNYQQAIIAFTAAIAIDPMRAEAYLGRGESYLASGGGEDTLSVAEEDFNIVLRIDEKNLDAWLGLADVAIARGEYDQAMEIMEKALEKTGGSQIIADKLEQIQAQRIGEMVSANDYSFLYGDSLVSVSDWTVGGKPIHDCTVKDFLPVYPDCFQGEYSHTVFGTTETYKPMVLTGKDTGTTANLEVEMGTGGHALTVNFYDRDLNAFQPELRGIQMGEDFDTAMEKLGFCEEGIHYIRGLFETVAEEGSCRIPLDYCYDENGGCKGGELHVCSLTVGHIANAEDDAFYILLQGKDSPDEITLDFVNQTLWCISYYRQGT